MDYRRVFVPGGSYFFTVVTFERKPILKDEEAIFLLKNAFRRTQNKYPFRIDALVILPDHLHTIWTLPQNDIKYPLRWNLIKGYFTKNWMHTKSHNVSTSRIHRREKEVWQRRYWEHYISDEKDFLEHMDYIHSNPVKHGLVDDPFKWKYSTIHKYD